MHPHTRLGWVHLSVADLDRSRAFYEGVLGLQVLRVAPGFAAMGVRAGDGAEVPIVLLSHQPHARPKPPRCRGLYHLALRLPSRQALARAVMRLAHDGYAIDGAADHWVSEAVYLSDPDGHGIELYADRPREQWPRQGDRILMGTQPLDWDGLVAELPPEERRPAADDGLAPRTFPGPHGDGMPPGTRLGHIHLHVSRLERAERFYRDVLGLDLVLRYGGSALFFSAGGYHHHVGANIWAGREAPPPPPDSVQLLHFAFVVPSVQDVAALARRLEQAGVPHGSLADLGPEALASVAPAGPSTGGFVTHDEDGVAVAVLGGEGHFGEGSEGR
ncbi:VOC family protein [Carboxydochorda subterranea]|uniref:VOC family protein n=1 Tax=Carboxydichorda subterranea TaxID=3109565 RepID=A0ABZ1C0N8_9FIRM|nr:VOC family protein [Limnochorda sp. L945t]WRP18670.1 VOC family protein [Limnochorda sp. L945t]